MDLQTEKEKKKKKKGKRHPSFQEQACIDRSLIFIRPYSLCCRGSIASRRRQRGQERDRKEKTPGVNSEYKAAEGAQWKRSEGGKKKGQTVGSRPSSPTGIGIRVKSTEDVSEAAGWQRKRECRDLETPPNSSRFLLQLNLKWGSIIPPLERVEEGGALLVQQQINT